MSIFAHLDTDRIAQDSTTVEQLWAAYVQGRTRRAALLQSSLNAESRSEYLELLKDALRNVQHEETREADIAKELETLAHEDRIKRVRKLEFQLGYAATAHKQLDALLTHLYQTLIAQTLALESGNETQLKKLLSTELEIGEQIQHIPRYRKLLTDLATGEHIVRRMTSDERRLQRHIEKGMATIFSGERTKGIVHDWAHAVLNAIEDEVHDAVASGTMQYHPDVDLEYVNSHAFETLVRATISRLRSKPVTDRTITVFIHLYREWQNSRS